MHRKHAVSIKNQYGKSKYFSTKYYTSSVKYSIIINYEICKKDEIFGKEINTDYCSHKSRFILSEEFLRKKIEGSAK